MIQRLQVVVLVFIMAWLFQSSTCLAAPEIDWENGYITVVAKGGVSKEILPKNIPKEMAMEQAITAAKMNGRRKLLEYVEGVHINSVTTVKDFKVESDNVTARISGTVKAFPVGEPVVVEDDYSYLATVQMRMCLVDNAPGCKKGESVASALPMEKLKSPEFRKKPVNCDLVNNIISTQAMFDRYQYDRKRPISMIMINLGGRAYNPDIKDIAIGYDIEGNQKCWLYAKFGEAGKADTPDAATIVKQGMAKIFTSLDELTPEESGNMIQIMAEGINGKTNHISIDEDTAYVLRVIRNGDMNKEIFKKARVGLLMR